MQRTNLEANQDGLLTQVDDFLVTIGQGFNAYLERRSRADEITRLRALSDEELRSIGVPRDRIVQHVFRDTFYI